MRKEKWLDEALREIRFFPDRKKVRRELEEHLEDRICEYAEMLEADGMNADDACKAAEEKAVSAMGDPRETGRQLNREHKPLLGFLWLGSWILVIVMLCVAIGVGVFLCKEKNYVLFQTEYTDEDYDRLRDSYIEQHYGDNPEIMKYNIQADYTVKISETEVTFYNFIYDNNEETLIVLLSSDGPVTLSSVGNMIKCNEESYSILQGRMHNDWELKKQAFYIAQYNDVNSDDKKLNITYNFFGNDFAFEVDIEDSTVKEVR